MNRTLLKSKHSCELSAAKKLFLLLLLLPLWSISEAAVQVKSISADYANKRVTFALSWAASTRNATHLSKVWVLVDYQEVNSLNVPAGAWQRATVVSATSTNGTVSGNTGRGFFVQGTDGAFSSTITVTLSSVPAKFNWCATATDYPPNATINVNGGYTLHGTVPFTINGNTTVSARTYTGTCITSITDATGCPGLLPAAPSVSTTNPTAVCAGSNVTLTANISGGTTTAMTYTWNIGSATATTTTNTFIVPAASITTSKTFAVSVRNANNCGSNKVNGNITINQPAGRDEFPNTCGCASELTLIAGYCRNLTADGASTFTGCGIEIKALDSEAITYVDRNAACAPGWRVPTFSEYKCMWNARQNLESKLIKSWYWSSSTSGQDYSCTCGATSGSAAYYFAAANSGCCVSGSSEITAGQSQYCSRCGIGSEKNYVRCVR